jgi:hypothetical protein
VNTAPVAVLKALMDDRDVAPRFWDEVLEFRNQIDEEIEENEDPPKDEYGEPITVKKFFHQFEDLAQIDGYEEIEPIHQGDLRNLMDVKSQVFSIYVTARRPTAQDDAGGRELSKEALQRQEEEGEGLVRTVRSVVWRRDSGDGAVEIVPLLRWEVVDYVPIEVVDFPDRIGERSRR